MFHLNMYVMSSGVLGTFQFWSTLKTFDAQRQNFELSCLNCKIPEEYIKTSYQEIEKNICLRTWIRLFLDLLFLSGTKTFKELAIELVFWSIF